MNRVQMMPIATLLGSETAQSHSDGDMQRLAGVVGTFGVLKLPVWNATQESLIDGAEWVEAAYTEGAEEIPCIVVELDEFDHMLAQIAVTASFGKRKKDLVVEYLHRLHHAGHDLDSCGLPPWQIEKYMLPAEEKADKPKFFCPKCGVEVQRSKNAA